MDPSPKPNRRELRHFGLVLGAMFAAVFGLLPLVRRHHSPLWPWIAATVLWAIALGGPGALAYVHRGWTRLGVALGWVNTRVILSALYALTIVPLGLVMRLFRRDPMSRHFDPSAVSYRVASTERPRNHMERPF